MVNANCSRERRSAVISIVRRASPPEIGLREINDLVTATTHDRLHHVEREALRHLEVDRGRHGSPVDDRIDENGVVMREGRGDSVLNPGGVFEPNAANTDGFGHCREIWIVECGPEIQEAGAFLLELYEAERAVVEDDDLYWQFELRQIEKVAH